MITKSQLKYIQSLGQKKHRDDEGLFIAEGPKLVKELLETKKAQLKYVYALNEWKVGHEKRFPGVDIVEASETELERMSQLKTPNQVLAVFKQFEVGQPRVEKRISLVLDTIQDPGNLGTIIRIADWFGIQQIFCSRDCADIYNPKVVQATMGSIARVKVFYIELVGWLEQQTSIRIYAAMLEGIDVSMMDPLKEGLIMIGNESKGIPEELLQYVDERITIPRKGAAESLNAAVATGIILSHLV